MAKYVCDFDTIKSSCDSLDRVLTELNSNLTTQKNRLDSDLVSWTGRASTSYQSSSNAITSNLQKQVETMTQMSSYIKDSVSKIEEVENSLAALKF